MESWGSTGHVKGRQLTSQKSQPGTDNGSVINWLPDKYTLKCDHALKEHSEARDAYKALTMRLCLVEQPRSTGGQHTELQSTAKPHRKSANTDIAADIRGRGWSFLYL
jgi:hypothetical protein